MNKDDRKQLDKAIQLLIEAKMIIDSVQEAEQMKFDNLSEGLQQAANGQKLEANADDLLDITSEIDTEIERLTSLVSE